MVALDKKTIEEKLGKLQEIIGKLEQDKEVSYEEFEHNFHISDSAMHNVAIGITIIVDIGNHILVETFQLTAGTYSKVIARLGEAGVIPDDFAKQHVDMPKFRNVLMHEYVEVDLKEVYKNFKKAPEVFRQFASFFTDFLDKHKD